MDEVFSNCHITVEEEGRGLVCGIFRILSEIASGCGKSIGMWLDI